MQSYTQERPLRCDIFCHVIDNFGDAGVCWRLARALSSEEGFKITLYIDDLATLARIAPGVVPSRRSGQTVSGVTVRGWEECLGRGPGDAVVETFGCRLPDAFEEAIAARIASGRPTAWLNLEYLSAEDWVEGCHGLPSPHPRLQATKTFFFPGFTQKTGGVLIERGLLEARDRFSPQDKDAALRSLGADPDSPFSLFFFSYPSAPVESLAASLAADPRPLQVLAAPGEAGRRLGEALRPLEAPQVFFRPVPAVAQDKFDRLLWCADALIVRGEDSFVRAQLSARPFLWTIYPQDENAHIVKLRAFMDRIAPSFLEPAGAIWREANLAWNENRWENRHWAAFRSASGALAAGGRRWAARLAGLGSLSRSLARQIKKELE